MAILNGYAEVEDLQEHLGDSRSDNVALMERAIESASRVIDTYCHRRFYLDTVPSSRTFVSSGDYVFTDDFVELTSVTPELSLGVVGTAYDATTYRPGPLNADITQEPYSHVEGTGFSWGYTYVEALWGWPVVPANVVQACLLKAARIYKRRETVTGTLGFEEFGPIRLGREDSDVIDILSPYRWVTVA